MMRARTWAASLAITCSAVPAQAACLSGVQAGALVRFALPAALTAVTRRCRPVLPERSYLARSGEALAARYRAASAGSLPDARAAMAMLAGGAMPAGISDATFSAMASDIIAGKIGDALPLDQCRYADATLEMLDPLPPENLERLTVLLMRLGARKDPHLRLCAEASRP